MRKHSVRKWIHAILDMLPLVIIPIFAIYSHRHQIEDYSVTRDEPNYIYVTQNIQNGKPILNGLNMPSWSFDNADSVSSNDNGGISIGFEDYVYLYQDFVLNDVSNHLFYMTFDYIFDVDNSVYISFNDDADIGLEVDVLSNTTFNEYYFTFSFVRNDLSNLLFELDNTGGFHTSSLKDIMLFDLTSIFGSGNEPSASDFNTWINGRFIDFGTFELQYGTKSVTYNDTDIGSQFMYQMYNVTDKYFNFNKIGNFNDIYGWFETNLFSGSAPLSFFIVWNIILYELIMDIIFLAYMVFMFIVDVAENMIDSFCERSRKGGR